MWGWIFNICTVLVPYQWCLIIHECSCFIEEIQDIICFIGEIQDIMGHSYVISVSVSFPRLELTLDSELEATLAHSSRLHWLLKLSLISVHCLHIVLANYTICWNQRYILLKPVQKKLLSLVHILYHHSSVVLIDQAWSDINMASNLYRKSHCGGNAILWPSNVHNGISYTGKTTSWYWIKVMVT